jgi:hypothetical protein
MRQAPLDLFDVLLMVAERVNAESALRSDQSVLTAIAVSHRTELQRKTVPRQVRRARRF